MHCNLLRLSGAALLAVLCACGGSADEAPPSDADGSATDLSAAPGADSSPPAVTASSADNTCGLAVFEADALRLINQRRAVGANCGVRGAFAPAGALVAQPQLTQAAVGHARDMAEHDYFRHDSRDGRTMADRVSATGYAWRSLGENIAAGTGTVQRTVDAWMASDGHCANLMNADFSEFGLACARAESSTYRTYWTLDLARR